MRVFCASIATETNTFAPLRTDFIDFQQSFYAPPGRHPETPTLCSAVFPALRRRARAGEIELIEGTAAWAEPGGLVNAATWARLRDEVLQQLRDALPVDAVVLGLHGAMVADGCDDCEGELLEAVRAIAGPDAKIGASFDPHSHLTGRRVASLDVLTAFKEFPHTDFAEAGEACAALTLRAAAGEIRPALSVFDIRMIDVLPTSLEPMRGFIDRIRALEGRDGILSISLIHGFMAADVAELGAKLVVVTDGRKAEGDALARELGMEVFSFRGRAKPDFLTPEEALQRAAAMASGPVVVADVWDNPGGGVPGDSTVLTRLALDWGLTGVAVGSIWDPMAVRLCHAAGKGARLPLRFGGKTSAVAGDPIDAEVEVLEIVRDAVQSFGDSVVPLGDAAAIRVAGIDVVLNSNRAQAFSPDLFSNLGIDPLAKKILIVKSTNHFYGAFAPIAAAVLYAEVKGPYPCEPRTNGYSKLRRPIWPLCEDPHGR
jgi:microcystin degradation protein MlrC